jgi:hypothetical protein
MATTNIGDNDMAGLDTNALIPNTVDEIGCLKKIKYFIGYVYCLTRNKIFQLLCLLFNKK